MALTLVLQEIDFVFQTNSACIIGIVENSFLQPYLFFPALIFYTSAWPDVDQWLFKRQTLGKAGY